MEYAMTLRRMHVVRPRRLDEVPEARALCDGLLQDLVALGMLTSALREQLDETGTGTELFELIETASDSIERRAEEVRALITRLRAA